MNSKMAADRAGHKGKIGAFIYLYVYTCVGQTLGFVLILAGQVV